MKELYQQRVAAYPDPTWSNPSPIGTPRIVICAHQPLAGDPRFPHARPRGGETSVAIIRDHLAQRWPVVTLVHGVDDFKRHLCAGDVALTWGNAAAETREACLAKDASYILMVRWWRNVCPLPPGDLRTREIPEAFKREKEPLFRDAHSVVTNNRYASMVVDRIYGHVMKEPSFYSYVPVLGQVRGGGNPGGPIVMVTDGKDLGSEEIVNQLAGLMPDRQFQVVNAKGWAAYDLHSNIHCTNYVDDMDTVWSQAGLLIYPNYKNDVCGTSRVGPEAMRWGVPCLANDRAGICETGMVSIPRDADIATWCSTIEKIYYNYMAFSNRSRTCFEDYGTDRELAFYEKSFELAFREGRV